MVVRVTAQTRARSYERNVRWKRRNLTTGRPRRPNVQLAMSCRSGPLGVGSTRPELLTFHFAPSLFDGVAKVLLHNTDATHQCGQSHGTRRYGIVRTRVLRHLPSRPRYFRVRPATAYIQSATPTHL